MLSEAYMVVTESLHLYVRSKVQRLVNESRPLSSSQPNITSCSMENSDSIEPQSHPIFDVPCRSLSQSRETGSIQ